VIAGDKVVPGRLVHAHGDDPCVADSSIDILMDHSPDAPVTGFVLLADNALAERVTVLGVEAKQKAHDDLHSLRVITRVDVTGDRQADVTFQAVRYEVPGDVRNGDVSWVPASSSWVGVAWSAREDTPYDRVTYPGCER
jgi:hypothetical protein